MIDIGFDKAEPGGDRTGVSLHFKGPCIECKYILTCICPWPEDKPLAVVTCLRCGTTQEIYPEHRRYPL
jgi:hypothetical protein